MSSEPNFPATEAEGADDLVQINNIINLMVDQIQDGLDHPELWNDLPVFIEHFPSLVDELAFRQVRGGAEVGFVAVLRAVAIAAAGDPKQGLALIEPIAVANSLLAVVQGALFHIQGLLDPGNSRYDLSDKFCGTPFHKFDVLDGSTHLCCASWIQQSSGDLNTTPNWQDVWNSDTSKAIRASIHDGSFRYCNKTACPHIGANTLPTKAKVASESQEWQEIIENELTVLPAGPKRVTLAYDKTCNLSCPSCRTEKYGADSAERARFDELQERAILPMLKNATLVDVTGSGDPFASKNFRHLMQRLTAEDYPGLQFQIMTNGMLLTPREWERFPSLHNGRISILRLSLDAATGPTHEKLRRGARWPVMEENLAFLRQLREQGHIGHLVYASAVQVDNYREMGDMIDLAKSFGADQVNFLRMTNWGTFTDAEYQHAAVFMPSHPQHADFLEAMQDPRLRDPIACLHDLSDFMRRTEAAAA